MVVQRLIKRMCTLHLSYVLDCLKLEDCVIGFNLKTCTPKNWIPVHTNTYYYCLVCKVGLSWSNLMWVTVIYLLTFFGLKTIKYFSCVYCNQCMEFNGWAKWWCTVFAKVIDLNLFLHSLFRWLMIEKCWVTKEWNESLLIIKKTIGHE